MTKATIICGLKKSYFVAHNVKMVMLLRTGDRDIYFRIRRKEIEVIVMRIFHCKDCGVFILDKVYLVSLV